MTSPSTSRDVESQQLEDDLQPNCTSYHPVIYYPLSWKVLTGFKKHCKKARVVRRQTIRLKGLATLVDRLQTRHWHMGLVQKFKGNTW